MWKSRDWDDVYLLQDEPFLSSFSSYALGSSGRRTDSASIESRLRVLAIEDLKKHDNAGSSPYSLVNPQFQRKKHQPSPRRASVNAKQRLLYPGALHAQPWRSTNPPNVQAHRERIDGNMLKRKSRPTKQYRGGFEGDKTSRLLLVAIKGEYGASLLDASHSQGNPRHLEVPPILHATSHLEKSRTIPFPSTLPHPLSNILPNSGKCPSDLLSIIPTCYNLSETKLITRRDFADGSLTDYVRQPRSQVDSGTQNAPFSSLSSSHAVINGLDPSLSTEPHDWRLSPSPTILDTSNNLDVPGTMQKMHPAFDPDSHCSIPGPEDLNSIPLNLVAPAQGSTIPPAHKSILPIRPPIWAQVERGFPHEWHHYCAYYFSF